MFSGRAFKQTGLDIDSCVGFDRMNLLVLLLVRTKFSLNVGVKHLKSRTVRGTSYNN